jgi:D-alanine-D-alanine ligase
VKPEDQANDESDDPLVSPIRKVSQNYSIQTINDVFAEWDSWQTINAVKEAIEKYHNVTLVEADYDIMEKLKAINPDIVFNIAEGFYGANREAQVPAILEMLNIPYTGSDPQTLSITLDKGRTKEILSYHNIATPKFKVVTELNEIDEINFNYPLIIKPNAEGSSKGIFSSSFAKNKMEMQKEVKRILSEYNQAALIEEFLPGREFTVALLGNGNEVEVLPIVEIIYKEFPKDFIPIYSYEAKWIIDTKENPLNIFECPANVEKKLEDEIKNICLNTFTVLRCRDWSRIDLRLDGKGIPNIIEVNPLPGILPDPKENSCFPKAARTAGYNYETMINRVLYSACKRYKLA